MTQKIGKLTYANYDFVFSLSSEDKCYKLSNQDIALISAHLEMMAWRTRWHSQGDAISEQQSHAVTDFVGTLANKLFTPVPCGVVPCDDNKPKDSENNNSYGLSYVRELEDRIAELEQELDDMACNCKLRWSKDGVLQMLSADPCGCDWIDIPVEGGVRQNPLGGSLGASVGFAMLNDDGTPRDVSIPLVKSNLNASAVELRACSKATALVRMFRNVIETSTMAEIREALDTIPFPTTGIVGAITAKILPDFLPIVGAFKLASIAADITDPIVDEINDKLTAKSEAEAICELYPLISKAYELTGEDIANTILSLGFKAGDASFLVVNALTQSLSVAAIKEHLELKFSDVECGCPDIVNRQSGINTNPPELATWGMKANFKTHAPSWYGFSVEYGNYVSGKGLDGAYDGNMTRNFAFIYKGLSGNTMLERVDVALANVVKGEFYSGNSLDDEIEGFYMRHRFVGGNPISVVPIKTPITQKSIGVKANEMTLQFMFGYREEDPNTIPDQTGFGTIESVTIWGRGTIPSDYSAWEQIYGT